GGRGRGADQHRAGGPHRGGGQRRRPPGADRLAHPPRRREPRDLLRRARRRTRGPLPGARVPAGHPGRDVAPLPAGRLPRRAGGGAGRPARGPGHPGARRGRPGREAGGGPMTGIARADYAALYGPTAGDQVRLGDTDLWIEVEEDRCAGGDEAVFGGGKSIRESMLQSTATSAEGALDLVVTNVVVLDHWGVVRADVGVRGGRITAVGKAGNPDVQDGVHPDLVIGPGTEVLAGEGRILTAGGIDSHVHFLNPEQLWEGL